MSLTKSDEAINPSSVIIRLTELLNKSLDEREKLLLQLDIPKLDGLHSEIYNEITALEMSSKMPENTIRIENLISLNNQIKNHLITYVIKHSAYNLEKALFTFRIGYPISMENGIPLESLSELYWKKENDLVKDKEFKFWEDRLLSMDSSIGLLIKCQKRAKNLLEDEKQKKVWVYL